MFPLPLRWAGAGTCGKIPRVKVRRTGPKAIRVNLSMNPAQMSSPPLPRSSLPPSSAPQDSQSPSARSSTRQATRRTRDALSFGDETNDAREDVTEASSRRKRRPRTEQLNGDVSIVKDAVGESVAEAFEAFLKT
jgi:DNA replication licensing factor MCM6